MNEVSVIIPTLYFIHPKPMAKEDPSTNLLDYSERIRGYDGVKEVILAINDNHETLNMKQTLSQSNEGSLHPRPRSRDDEIKVVYLGKNRGFTGACNAGARAATGKYLLFLNDDCEMNEENFIKLIEFLEKNPELVATQPIVLKQIPSSTFPASPTGGQIPSSVSTTTSRHPCESEDPMTDLSDSGPHFAQGFEVARQARMTNPPSRYTLDAAPSKEIENIGFMVDPRIGKAIAITDSSRWSVVSNQMQNKREGSLPAGQAGLDIARDARSNPSDNCHLITDNYLYGLSGTCLLVRKDIFEKVGMWDESFHSYLEDVDLCIRMRKFGYKFAPCLSASVTHAHMSTSKRMGMYKPTQDMKNWWRLIFKHSDVFVHFHNLIPLLLERGRNANGVLKALLRIKPMRA